MAQLGRRLQVGAGRGSFETKGRRRCRRSDDRGTPYSAPGALGVSRQFWDSSRMAVTNEIPDMLEGTQRVLSSRVVLMSSKTFAVAAGARRSTLNHFRFQICGAEFNEVLLSIYF